VAAIQFKFKLPGKSDMPKADAKEPDGDEPKADDKPEAGGSSKNAARLLLAAIKANDASAVVEAFCRLRDSAE